MFLLMPASLLVLDWIAFTAVDGHLRMMSQPCDRFAEIPGIRWASRSGTLAACRLDQRVDW